MEDMTFEKLSGRISESLNVRIKELGKTVEDIARNFRNLGLTTAVWHPEKIHAANLGGVDADSYLGYSRVEGKWGLIIRTIERDHESHAFIGQRVYPIQSCSNIEIVISSLKKVRELAKMISGMTERQIKLVGQTGGEFEELRNPGCGIE